MKLPLETSSHLTPPSSSESANHRFRCGVRRFWAAEITSADYPGERLVVCKNPLLAEERGPQTRGALGRHGEGARAHRGPGAAGAPSAARTAAIGQAVGAVLGRRPKHFQITIGDDAFSFAQNLLSIGAEAALDGIYVVRTSLPAAHSDGPRTSPRSPICPVSGSTRCISGGRRRPSCSIWIRARA
jgi:hypothetical protein